MTPIIFSQFGAAFLGEYAMVTTVSLLLSQVISLNPTAVIIRSSDKKNVCIQYTFFYYVLSLTILFVSCTIYFSLDLFSITNYFALFFILASAEALFMIVVAFFRANDMYIRFVLIVLFKSLIIGSYLFYSEPDFHSIILLSAGVAFVMSMIFIMDMFWAEKNMLISNLINFKLNRYINDVFFGIKLIPHSFGLWGFSSATKVIIKIIVGSVALGLFTVYFTFAFPIVLINSALTLYLPREIVREPLNFVNKKKDLLFFKGYTTFVFFIVMLIALFCYFDNIHNFYIQSYSQTSIFCIVLSCLAFYNFGTYQFLANYLFYARKSGTLSKNTMISAACSVVASVIFTYIFNIIGAVIALYLSSFFYVYVTYKSVEKISTESNATLIWNKFCSFSASLLVVCLLVGYVVL